jgi:hypothetical protein
MPTFEVPISATASQFTQVTSLDGIPYVLDFSWSDRVEAWYLDLYLQTDDESTPIALGRKLVLDYPLLAFATVVEGCPPGRLVVYASVGGDPKLDDLGTRVKLYYVTD